MRDYVDYHNNARTHQSTGQQTPVPQPDRKLAGAIHCRTILGIIKYYYRDAA